MSVERRWRSVWGVALLAVMGLAAAAGEPPIIAAVKGSDAAAVRTFLAQGADVNRLSRPSCLRCAAEISASCGRCSPPAPT
jgi:hypothetical protein